MNKMVKKLVTMALSGSILLSMNGLSVNAAGNYKDTYFTNFTITSSAKCTTARQKLDTTSATVKLSKAATAVVVRVYGATSSSGTKHDCTYGTPKVVSASSKYTYLPNTVKEKGYTWAKLGFTRSGVNNVTISGAWSPDSI